MFPQHNENTHPHNVIPIDVLRPSQNPSRDGRHRIRPSIRIDLSSPDVTRSRQWHLIEKRPFVTIRIHSNETRSLDLFVDENVCDMDSLWTKFAGHRLGLSRIARLLH